MKSPMASCETQRERAHRLVPGGCHTYSKGDDQFPALAPAFIVRGNGSHVWDSEGTEYVDWGMGLRSVVLGHHYEPVVAEVKKQLGLGCNFIRPSPIEADVAELLVNTIPCAEMAKFAKNGSDVTTAAVKLARAHTGREIVVRCQQHPFFSIDDWFIGDTPCDAGVPRAIKRLTKRFSYNNLESLELVFSKNPRKVACVIMEPAATEEPTNDFLRQVHSLCRREGALLIFDEMITGFRWHVHGAQAHYGVTPDLATFGKAMGNGFSCSVLVGRKDVMELGGLQHRKPRVFLLSTTHGGETHALAAARKTIEIIQQEPVIEHIWAVGRKLQDGFNTIAAELGIDAHVKMAGLPCSPYLTFRDHHGKDSPTLRTLYLQEAVRHGVLIPYIAPSYSHSESDIDQTVEASRKAFLVLVRALQARSVDRLLVGPSIKPVFRRFN